MFDKGNCCVSSNIIVLYELCEPNWRGVLQVERLFVPCWFFSIIYTTVAFYNANARHRPRYEDSRYFSLFLLGGPLGLTIWQRNVFLIDIYRSTRPAQPTSRGHHLARNALLFCPRRHLKDKLSLNLFPWQSRVGKPKQVWKIISSLFVEGHAVAQLVEAVRCKPESWHFSLI
jgi:hypothetical protein